MSSILSETLSSVFESMNPYLNEVVAIALFGVGYFLFRTFSFKKPLPEKAKQNVSIVEAPIKQDTSVSLYQFNVYIRDNLSHKPNVNPFEILHQMQIEGLIPDITSYNTLLDICVEQRNYETCWKLLEQMKDSLSPVKPDIITFNTLMKGLSLKIEEGFSKRREDIEEIFQQMERLKADIIESGLLINEITYNTMIDACVKANRMKKAFDYFDEMQSQNLKPDVYTYSTLIKGIKNPECITPENNLTRVFGILERLKEIKLVKTDEILYNCVIDACFKFGDYQKAIRLFNDMLAAGVKPSAITYGIMIKGYGQYKNIDGALQIYERMIIENITMNEITLGCLIDACVKCNNLSRGMEILEKEHNKANTIIYTTVLKGYTKEKNLEKAMEIFQRMKANDASKPNIVTLNSLLDCAVQCFHFDKMDSIYKEIITNKSTEGCDPDLITYSTYIKGLCRAKRVDEAYELYQKLKREKVFKLDEVLYNSLLDGLVKIKENDRAMEVYNSMLADGICPSNVTYSILIKLFGNQGKVDEALSIHRQMKREGIRPGLIVYTCLVQTCVKHKRINLLEDLHNEMNDNKIVGDPVFYNTLISGLVYNQNLRKGVEILIGTLEKNIRLNDEVYTNILKNLCKIMERKNGNYEAPGSFNKEETEINLLKICQLMKRNKIFIEMNLYNQIASYLYKDIASLNSPPQTFNSSYNNNSNNNNNFNNNNGTAYRRNLGERQNYSDSKPRSYQNYQEPSEPAPRKPAFQVNSGIDSGRKPAFFNKNKVSSNKD